MGRKAGRIHIVNHSKADAAILKYLVDVCFPNTTTEAGDYSKWTIQFEDGADMPFALIRGPFDIPIDKDFPVTHAVTMGPLWRFQVCNMGDTLGHPVKDYERVCLNKKELKNILKENCHVIVAVPPFQSIRFPAADRSELRKNGQNYKDIPSWTWTQWIGSIIGHEFYHMILDQKDIVRDESRSGSDNEETKADERGISLMRVLPAPWVYLGDCCPLIKPPAGDGSQMDTDGFVVADDTGPSENTAMHHTQ